MGITKGNHIMKKVIASPIISSGDESYLMEFFVGENDTKGMELIKRDHNIISIEDVADDTPIDEFGIHVNAVEARVS